MEYNIMIISFGMLRMPALLRSFQTVWLCFHNGPSRDNFNEKDVPQEKSQYNKDIALKV